MCGFLVHVPIRSTYIDKKKFLIASNYIKHRGPDNSKVFFHKKINIVFHRLRIRDLSANGDQPMMSNSKKYIIVFNGEIYNTNELIKKYNLTTLKSNSDTEVLLALFEKYGKKIINELDGMFSFVIYNFQLKSFIAYSQWTLNKYIF